MYRSNSKEVGERLRAARLAAGLTQCAAADEIGVTPQFISLLEKGKRPLNLKKLLRLALLYGVSADFLLYGVSSAAAGSVLGEVFRVRGSTSEPPVDVEKA